MPAEQDVDDHLVPLAQAYAAVRRDRMDAGACLILSKVLALSGRLAASRRHALRAGALAPPRSELTIDVGEWLFEIGEFDIARRILEPALASTPTDADALCTLSALRQRDGDTEAARQVLLRSAELKPISAPRHHRPHQPAVLRIRCVENSFYGILQDGRTGRHRRRLKDGHFSVKNLIDKKRVNLFIASIAGDNLLNRDDLPPFRLAINSVSCADLNPGGLQRIDRFLARFPHIPVINPPRKVLATTRAQNARRLGSLDAVRFPRTEMFCNDAAPNEVADRLEQRGFGYPLIVRLPGTQTGDSMSREDTRADFMGRLAATPPGVHLYAIEYIDCRDRRGLFHKTRAFFIDGVFYPVANLTSDVWQIHSADRYRVMVENTASRRAELRYLRDPEAHLGARVFGALHEIARIIDLDFFGIDFTTDRDGRVLVFEANAAMRHNYEHATAFPYTRAHLDRVSDAFDRMVHRRLAEAPDGDGSAVHRSAPDHRPAQARFAP